MWGCLFYWNDESMIACQLPDGQIYIHDPICDTFGSKADALDAYPGSRLEMIGPVVALPVALQALHDTHAAAIQQLNAQIEVVNAGYESQVKMLSDFSLDNHTSTEPLPEPGHVEDYERPEVDNS
jgi:hypothetical protein